MVEVFSSSDLIRSTDSSISTSFLIWNEEVGCPCSPRLWLEESVSSRWGIAVATISSISVAEWRVWSIENDSPCWDLLFHLFSKCCFRWFSSPIFRGKPFSQMSQKWGRIWISSNPISSSSDTLSNLIPSMGRGLLDDLENCRNWIRELLIRWANWGSWMSIPRVLKISLLSLKAAASSRLMFAAPKLISLRTISTAFASNSEMQNCCYSHNK